MNISIDDLSSDPITGARITYGIVNQTNENEAGWNIGQNCSDCLAQPDPSQTYNRTWHDASLGPSGTNNVFASVSFTGALCFSTLTAHVLILFFLGVAIYVVGITVFSSPPTTQSLNNSKIFFQVDGEDQGSFLHSALVGMEVVYSYNTILFSKEGLSEGLHNVTMICGDGSSTVDSLCLLDRFIYR